MTSVLLFGLVQALFFSLIILAKRHKDVADYLLALLFILLGYEFWVNWIFLTGRIILHPHFFGTALPLVLLIGPLLFFYVKIHISPGFRFKAAHLWHFVPYLVLNIVYLPFFMLSAGEKIVEYQNLVIGRPSSFLSFVLLASSFSPLIYAVWSVKVLKRHRNMIPELYSYINEKMKADWLWYLTWSLLIVSGLTLFLNAIIAFSDIADWIRLRLYVSIFSVIWVFLLGYYGIRRTSFFQAFPLGTELSPQEIKDLEQENKKYVKTKISQGTYEKYKKKLLDHMESEKPYLNKRLTLTDLASQIGVPAYVLSQLLNEYLDQNFFEFVNQYRVEEVKKRYADPASRNLKLIGIAQESGFNSKSSFNRIFKQQTGKSPSEYFKLLERVN